MSRLYLGEVAELALVEVAQAGEQHDARHEGQVGEDADPHLGLARAGGRAQHHRSDRHGGHVHQEVRVHGALLAIVGHLELLHVLVHRLLVVAAAQANVRSKSEGSFRCFRFFNRKDDDFNRKDDDGLDSQVTPLLSMSISAEEKTGILTKRTS
eukprot:1178919-Prorocentrum_minimum.AAC.4